MTERWGREHGVGGGVKETGVLGWGGTIAGAVAVAVAVAVAAAVAVAVGLEAVGDATTAGALRCLVGVVGGVGRYEASSGVSSCGNVETIWAEGRPNEAGGVE
jgi:hypothetical protein